MGVGELPPGLALASLQHCELGLSKVTQRLTKGQGLPSPITGLHAYTQNSLK